MKIAVVFPYFAHYRKPIVEELSEKDSDKIDFIFYGGTKVSPQFEGMKLMNMSHYNFVKAENHWFCKYFSFQTSLLPKIKKETINAVIIFADWKFLSTWRLVFYCRKNKIPIIFWSHAFRENSNSLNNIVKRIYFKLFSGGLVFDNRALKILNQQGFKKVKVVYNSLDFKNQSQILNSIQNERISLFNNSYPFIVFTGRLSLTKNIHLVLEALSFLKSKGVFVNLVLVGDGVDKARLKEITEKLGLTNQVNFFGSCYDENIIATIINNALASVIPSAVGLSAIHALTYRCPVITDNNFLKHGPEVEAVVEGKTGKYYQHNSYEDLAAKIQFFLKLNAQERQVFANNCENIIKEKYNSSYQKQVIKEMVFKVCDINYIIFFLLLISF